jgi:hypothetical protein
MRLGITVDGWMMNSPRWYLYALGYEPNVAIKRALLIRTMFADGLAALGVEWIRR